MAVGKKDRKAAAVSEPPIEPVKKPNKILRIVKITGLAVAFLCLIAGGFFLGVYFRVFDVNTMNEKLGLHEYPIIGQYFEKPKAAESDEAPVETQSADKGKTQEKAAGQAQDISKLTDEEKAKILAEGKDGKKIVLNKEEIEKQLQQRKAEEQKRVAKLARLYGEMKASQAVGILSELDDDMVLEILSKMSDDQVSEILPLFDTTRGARLTKLMYNGRPPVAQVR